ncbi:MAG: helix-turn-helix domain-containing protein, partial [Desulfuromusa sp.]|nr:helix-turn-helix domain-containing protein [Desulfuromusa sp.]
GELLMPAKLTTISAGVTQQAIDIGKQIRAYRKALGVSATTAAEAAGMSRVTWYRIEKGATSITQGAFLSALAVLGLDLRINQYTAQTNGQDNDSNSTGSVPVHIALSDYPQLKRIAWQVHGIDVLSPREALIIYERNWRHLDFEAMETDERNLVDALRQIFSGDTHNV